MQKKSVNRLAHSLADTIAMIRNEEQDESYRTSKSPGDRHQGPELGLRRHEAILIDNALSGESFTSALRFPSIRTVRSLQWAVIGYK